MFRKEHCNQHYRSEGTEVAELACDILIMWSVKIGMLKEAKRSSACLLWPNTSVMSSFNCVWDESFATHSHFHTKEATSTAHNHTLTPSLAFHLLTLLSGNLHDSPESVRPSRLYFSSMFSLVCEERCEKYRGKWRKNGARAYLMFTPREVVCGLFCTLTTYVHEYFLTTRPPGPKDLHSYCSLAQRPWNCLCVKGKDSLVTKPLSVTHTSAYLCSWAQSSHDIKSTYVSLRKNYV